MDPGAAGLVPAAPTRCNGKPTATHEKVVRQQALAYVVRDGHLLVLRHTDYSYEEVGIQVPAGGAF